MTLSASRDAVTPQRAGRILWRRKLICLAVTAIILAGGTGWLLSRHKVYQSSSMVALLPVTTNGGVLPNYPNLVASLIPTYVQLVSSPVLLDRVAATVPFHVTESQLATQVHGASMSSAAVISIVADDGNAVRAQEIAEATTTAFLAKLQGNGVVIPQVYGQPTVPSKTTAPDMTLVLAVLVAVALICGAAAGLAWDRLSGGAMAAAAVPSEDSTGSAESPSAHDGPAAHDGPSAHDGSAARQPEHPALG